MYEYEKQASERGQASKQVSPHHTPHQYGYGGLTENTTRVERLEPHLNTNTRYRNTAALAGPMDW